MRRLSVLSIAVALLASSTALAGGLDQPQSDFIGSCQNAQFDHGHTSWDCGQSMMDRGHHCGGCGQCGWGYHHQFIVMVQYAGSVGHCCGTHICQSIHISSDIGCGPRPCDGQGGCGQACGISSQSCMILSTHSTRLGGAGMMMASQYQVIH